MFHTEERAVEGIFHYLHKGAEPSLFRNGKVSLAELEMSDGRLVKKNKHC